MSICLRCKKTETTKVIDGVPVCQACMLKDAANNKGCVIDYSSLRAPVPKRETVSPERPTSEREPAKAKSKTSRSRKW